MTDRGDTGSERNRLLALAAQAAQDVDAAIEHRTRSIREAKAVGCTYEQLAKATGLSQITIKRAIYKWRLQRGDKMNQVIEDTWSKYEDRYGSRPETYTAYVDVWKRIPATRSTFTGWASFTQAANAEPAQSGDRIRAAEDCMVAGGYKLGPLTNRGARRWVKD